MGDHGPIPKRSSQRRRRNATDRPITTATSTGKQYGPPLAAGRKHSAAARRFYESLRTSGEAQFYEDSDWAYAADIICTAIDAYIAKPSAAMLTAITQAMSPLLATEGERRRARLELERPTVGEEPDVPNIDVFRRRLQAR